MYGVGCSGVMAGLKEGHNYDKGTAKSWMYGRSEINDTVWIVRYTRDCA